MQPSDVTMYGRDYSEREFTHEEFERYERENPNEPPVNFLGRYIGYPGNPKCISSYPGMYRHHLNAGRPSFLFHQIGYGDMDGGFDAGRFHAETAKLDAESSRVGWKGESHIIACMDRFYVKQGWRTLTAADLREYMRGFRSVLGDRAGFYGFYDSMSSAVSEGWASFFVQCGARSAHIPGIHAWQENNRQPKIFGTPTDILELYCDPDYAFGGDVYNHERDYEEMAKTLTRWYIYSSRPKGGRPTHEDGATLPEMLADIAAKQVTADIDEEALADAMVKRGIDLGGIDVSEMKQAFGEVLFNVLKPATDSAEQEAQAPATDDTPPPSQPV